MTTRGRVARGFTLIELLTTLVLLSLLALMTYRGLSAVLDAREHVRQETEKWQSIAAFVSRFESDLRLAAPRSVRSAHGTAPAWQAWSDATLEPQLEFSRFAAAGDTDLPRRLAYRLNASREIELLLWAGLDNPPGATPARYPLLRGVAIFELQFLTSKLAWARTWPMAVADSPLPHAVQLRLVLSSGEEIVRVFALES